LRCARLTNIKIEDLPPIAKCYGYWLSGLIDGEGSFNLIHVRAGGRSYVRPGFHIGLRDDDGDIIREIAHRLGIKKTIHRERAYANSKPQAELHITSWGGCRKIVQFIEQFPLQTRKRRDFEIWREAVLLKTSFQPCEEKLFELRDRLMQQRKYSGPT